MSVLLLHLSDLHLRSQDDIVLSRIDAIASAARGVDYHYEAVVIAIAGDLAYSGLDSEYQLALDFLAKLSLALATPGSVAAPESIPVHVVAVPGNHDCDFSETRRARDIVIASVVSDPTTVVESSIVDLCTAVQSQFFDFLGCVETSPRNAIDDKVNNKLAYSYEIPVGDSVIRFLCVNSAYVSKLPESQGQIVVSADVLPDKFGGERFSVVMFHHPYAWFETNAGRQFRNRAESVADIVLTGHEHVAARRRSISDEGPTNTYVEGGVLQEHGASDVSAFNVLHLDLTERRQKFVRFHWSGGRYERSAATAGTWEGLPLNFLRKRGRYQFRQEFLEALDDPGVGLLSATGAPLTLRQVFVFPDLREVVYVDSASRKVVKGATLVDFVAGRPRTLITGQDQAGKSALAKMFCFALHARGEVPILVDARESLPRDRDKLHRLLDQIVRDSYEGIDEEAARQLEIARRVIVVDNFDYLASRSSAADVMSGIESYAGRVILIGNELNLMPSESSEPLVPVATFGRLEIQQFGYARRSELVDRWLEQDSALQDDSVALATKHRDITRALNQVVGRNFVPAFPVYVLSVLQVWEDANPVDTRASTHGYFYEAFIRMALHSESRTYEFDLLSAFLAHLAYQVWKSDFVDGVSEALAKKIVADYENAHDVRVGFSTLFDQLCAKRILVKGADGDYRFKYRYIYYYFVALYLRDRVSDEVGRSDIRSLGEDLRSEENCNIFLFLAHLSKDPVIVESIVAAAAKLFEERPVADLNTDVSFINDDSDVLKLSVGNGDEKANRQRYDERRDATPDDPTGPDDGQSEASRELRAAFRTLQILGQILKNFPGSLNAAAKQNLAQGGVDLGRRIIGAMIEDLRAIKDDLVDLMAEAIIQEANGKLTSGEARTKAADYFTGVGRAISMGLTDRIASSLGGPLLFPTYEKIATENDVPVVKLVLVAIEIEHSPRFPVSSVKDLAKELSGNRTAMFVLRALVAKHFQLFPVEFSTKQAVCSMLGISFAALQGRAPRELGAG